MNPQTLEEAKELFSFYIDQTVNYSAATVVVCPPIIYLEELSKLLPVAGQPAILLGSQDFFWETTGAFTGQTSLNMLQEFDVKYALLGHSEKRYIAGETDDMINRKLHAALEHQVTPILLVGEREKDYSREDTLIDQLSSDLVGIDKNQVPQIVFVYEPVWAISSNSGGQSDTPENAIEAIKIIKNIVAKLFSQDIASDVRVLYGGSINSQNIASFLMHDEIAGAVIGSASLKKEEFDKILELVAH